MDITASLQLEAARIMKIAALNGEKRFIDHADKSYYKMVADFVVDPLACADYERRQVRLQAVHRELLELQSVPLPTALA
jgi:hypothetical protein